jgi:glycosyltransferase involved in cell wall biosynthesis
MKLRIGHVTKFAPSRCGLYEATRDMVISDILLGHEVYVFDAGLPNAEGQNVRQVGARDDRCGFTVITADPDQIQYMDLLIMHTGIEDTFVVKGDCPILWVIHGRPNEGWISETKGIRNTYTLYKSVASWQRCKGVMYFWPEFVPYWKPVIPNKTHYVSQLPCIDTNRYTTDGKKYQIQNKGEFNILICDSVRDDIGLFELMIACIEAARVIKCLKFHFIGSIDNWDGNCYQYLLNELQSLDALGDVSQRVLNIEEVYRSMDLLISPNRIVNRVVMEAIMCGLPVIQEYGGSVNLGTKVYFADSKCLIDLLKNKSFDNNVIEKQKLFDRNEYVKFTKSMYDDVFSKLRKDVV